MKPDLRLLRWIGPGREDTKNLSLALDDADGPRQKALFDDHREMGLIQGEWNLIESAPDPPLEVCSVKLTEKGMEVWTAEIKKEGILLI